MNALVCFIASIEMEDLCQPLLTKPSCNDHRATADQEELILGARSIA